MSMTITQEFAALVRRAIPMLECMHASNTNEMAAEGRALLARFDSAQCRHVNIELDLGDGARATCTDCGASEASRPDAAAAA